MAVDRIGWNRAKTIGALEVAWVMEARLTCVVVGTARCMAPSGLKKALSFRTGELALQVQCERDVEVVRLASLEREQQRPHPERILERICDQSGVIEVTKISSKDQTLQRTGDQILEGFAQDRLQQRSFEQNIVPEMIEQLGGVPKTMSQNGTAEQIVDLPAPVFPERISERICEQSGVIDVTKISSQDRKLQRTVEQMLAVESCAVTR